MLWVPETKLLILEVRNEARHETCFSALDFEQNRFLWKDILMEETWWIGLTAATNEVLLLQVYQNTGNPDVKGLLAWHMDKRKKLWQVDNFSFGFLTGDKVYGQCSGTEEGNRPAIIDVNTGEFLEINGIEIRPEENIVIPTPFQYIEGSPYFETAKSFLMQKLNLVAIAGVEYLEHNSLIFISYNMHQEGLTNYLVVLTSDGEILLHEKLGEQLKGLGLETFFILSGCLFFVRNKSELVSYRIV